MDREKIIYAFTAVDKESIAKRYYEAATKKEAIAFAKKHIGKVKEVRELITDLQQWTYSFGPIQ